MADCLNGGVHKYEPTNLFPPYDKEGEYVCRVCYEKKKFTKDEAKEMGLVWNQKWDQQKRQYLNKIEKIITQLLEARQQEDEDLIKDLQGHLLTCYGVKMTFENN